MVTVAGDTADPFRVADLPADALREDPVRLADEAAALPFSGGKRVVRIRDGKEALTAAVRNLLAVGGGNGLVVIEAGDLGPRSPLRQLFEGERRAAALPCYADEGGTLRRVIEDELTARGLGIAPEAMDILASHLGADRGVTRSELEKLALYKQQGRIDVDDVLAVVAEAGTVSLDTIAYAACGGDFSVLDHALATASAEGVSPIPLLRGVARHLQRLAEALAGVAKGSTADQAMAALKPAVFYRLRSAFRAQMNLWDASRLGAGLMLLAQTELECKQTGAPQQLLCQRALVRLAAIASSAAGRS